MLNYSAKIIHYEEIYMKTYRGGKEKERQIEYSIVNSNFNPQNEHKSQKLHNLQ